jgi:hypothetical protein
MAYYHVVVKLQSAPGRDVCLFSDLGEAELKKQFLRAYDLLVELWTT